ncbi:hypothetical protein SS50377_26644 [Spironucleus salmonicida]|uniref:Uncharacterized protein n=1 Tax=Spironucleus salmonicida TaxID=348837 RepID=V6LLD7_9EUKA|nr:hypothetical protein SS50377_26644 [Spironucleus salmonicida]|eukprot:EST41489.1 Hypothetical protein SS50377_19216 [Spironucleus salmonicida]
MTYQIIHDIKKRANINLQYALEQISIQASVIQKLIANKPEPNSYGMKFPNILASVNTRLMQLKQIADEQLVDRKDIADLARKVEEKLQKVEKEIDNKSKKLNGKKQQEAQTQIVILQQTKSKIEQDLQTQLNAMQLVESKSTQILDQFYETFNPYEITMLSDAATTLNLLNFNGNQQAPAQHISPRPNEIQQQPKSQVQNIAPVAQQVAPFVQQASPYQQQPSYNTDSYQQQSYQSYPVSQDAALDQFQQQTQQNAYATAQVSYEDQLAVEWNKQQQGNEQVDGYQW